MGRLFRYIMRRFGWRIAQVFGLVLLSGGLGLFATYTLLKPTVPESADLWTINKTRATTFLDWQGEVIGSRGGLHTEPVRLNELPDHLVLAFLTTEDKRFYDHGAIDWLGIARAMAINVWEGRFVQGGSTITQQLAKNIFLTQERTIARKVKEVILARQLEERLTKDEILELYLNRIYLGAGAFGVEAAAQTYFDKSARQVTLSEAAMLAGLAKAPSRYAPTTNLEVAQGRAKVILQLLRENDVVSEEQYAAAFAAPATLAATPISGEVNYFLDYVSSEVARIRQEEEARTGLNWDEGDNALDDLVVTTTLSATIQGKAERNLIATLTLRAEKMAIEQGALVAMATDGAVRAMVGGRSYARSQFNRAVQAKRQPGSAFKPFVYLTALQQGMRPDSIYYDEPIRIGDWAPKNYAGGYRGRVTMTEALQHSVNTVAVRVAQDVGADNVIATAQNLGITSALEANRSLPLGTSEVTLLELTSAYIPFATRGRAATPHAVLKIATNKGVTLWEYEAAPMAQVISPDMAAGLTHMMYQVIHGGTGGKAKLGTRPAAGKTGTSQDWRDAWFMGYTGDLITGVWVGNDDSSPMNKVTGGGVPAEIWQGFMKETHQGWAVTALPGAYPATAPRNQQDMKRFLADLSRQFARFEKTPKGSKSSKSSNRNKPKWWPF